MSDRDPRSQSAESPTTRRLKRMAITQLARVRARIQRLEQALADEDDPQRKEQLESELEDLEMSYDHGELEVRRQ